MAGIAYHKPFNNGNKATAFVITKHYLRKNGFKLILQTKNDEKELFDLLHMVSMKFEGEPITKEIESYIDSKIKPEF